MTDCTSWELLPVVLQARHIQAILGISKGAAYQLMNRKDSPKCGFMDECLDF